LRIVSPSPILGTKEKQSEFMPVKDKAKRSQKSHSLVKKRQAPAPQPFHHRRAAHLETEEEELPEKNRIADFENSAPPSKRNHAVLSDSAENMPRSNALATRKAGDSHNEAEPEPSPEDLQAEEETVKAAAGSVPRDEDVLAVLPKERGSYDADTAIKLYLREIGQVKLLTPQEEIELAAKIKKATKKPART
jgi:hypothetical protein